jgi:hypothetical protein
MERVHGNRKGATVSRVNRTLAFMILTSAMAIATLGGVAVGTASAATVTSSGSSIVKPDWIAGYYASYSSCNAAGAAGIRKGTWTNYICVFSADADAWALSVEYDV